MSYNGIIANRVTSVLLNRVIVGAARNATKQIKKLLLCDDLVALLEPNLAPDIVAATAKASGCFDAVKHIKISVRNREPIVKTGLSLLADSEMDLAIINAAAAFE